MDGLSSATSVIAVIQLTGSIVKICGGYIQEAKNARDEILELQQAVTDLEGVLRELNVLLQSPNGSKLSSSQTLASSITRCRSTLEALEEILQPGRRKQAMRRLGLRALAWPIKRKQAKGIASDLQEYKSTFTLSLQIDQITVVTAVRQTTDRIDYSTSLGQLSIAQGAEFDSYANQHEDYCLPGTRIDLLRQIKEWASSPTGKGIFWLNGKAGTGKSTISRTMTQTLNKANLLGANFFFKRGEGDRGNAMKLLPTITRQLVRSIPELFPGVQKALQDDPDIAKRGLKEQFNKLLLEPLYSLVSSTLPTVVIVIDALDECDSDDDMRLILGLLSQLQKLEAVYVRVFLTSRPEWPIFQEFSRMPDEHEDLILHEIPKPVIEQDISLFLKHRLSAIQTDRSLPVDWPGMTNFQYLVTLSVPLFIFAATICRILEDPYWDPKDSLKEILAHENDTSKLDGTYLPVLKQLLAKQGGKQKNQMISQFQQVVGAIVVLESPLSVISLSNLIGLPHNLVNLRLRPLHSVLSVPDDDNLPVRLFHLSFRDYLLDPETRNKTPLWVDEKKVHYTLTTQCLLVCQNLRRNICELPSDATQRADIDQKTINHYLSPELQYSCRYWAHHLVKSTELHCLMHDTLLFLQTHFLHWMEAMNLLGLGPEVVGIINLLQTGLPSNHNTISEFLYDAKRFVLKTHQMADELPLQIYCSGLVFAPLNSIIRKQFEANLPRCISQMPCVENTWGAELQAWKACRSVVKSVAFSPDGRLASGCHNGMVWLWDTATVLQQTLKAGANVVSVVFSPDGGQLAAGVRHQNHMVELWNITTGVLQLSLGGYPNGPISVAFSPDGRLASGSGDGIVRFWDTATGALQRTLEGHSAGVTSLSFSPDGLLASGSDDNTIKIWNTATGALQWTLEGHSASVTSLSFSPDGLLASGSDDNTIKLWNTATGALKQTLEGHSAGVTSLAFSPDGRLASGSQDRTVRLWDATIWVLQQTLGSHTAGVTSVAFSPDGRLASGSEDATVKLWDTAIGDLQRRLKDYSGTPEKMLFSFDRRLLACAYDNDIVRLWDSATGALQHTLEGHLQSSTPGNLTFSSDDRLLASGNASCTLRLWDTTTGVLQQTLEGYWGIFSSDDRLMAFPSSKYIVAPFEHKVRLWDIPRGVLRHTFEGHSDEINSVSFSPDGGLLVSGSRDRTVRLWDTVTGILRHTLVHIQMVSVVTFSPNGRLVVASCYGRTVRLWDTVTGTLQQTLEGFDWPVSSFAFSSDGHLLACAFGIALGYTVQLWNTSTYTIQQTWRTGEMVKNIKFSNNDSCLKTDTEFFDFQSRSGDHTSESSQSSPIISLDGQQWIILNGEKFLHLPPEAVAYKSAVKGNTLAISSRSGRVCFMKFR